MMMVLQVVICICTGIMSPLVWSMYADVSDYAELRYRTASTGLIFSSSSMAQKFGGAVGGAAVLWLLSAFGYQESLAGSAAQPEAAISCLWFMMSWLPAIVALLAVGVASFYPLTTEAVNDIVERLRHLRAGTPGKDVPTEDEMTDFANV